MPSVCGQFRHVGECGSDSRVESLRKLIYLLNHNFPENTCGDGDKQSLHLNNPAIFIFNSTVRRKFPCHLELHLHSKSLGFSVFIETLKVEKFLNSDCSKDYIQFGRDSLFITTFTSKKYCQNIEHTYFI